MLAGECGRGASTVKVVIFETDTQARARALDFAMDRGQHAGHVVEVTTDRTSLRRTTRRIHREGTHLEAGVRPAHWNSQWIADRAGNLSEVRNLLRIRESTTLTPRGLQKWRARESRVLEFAMDRAGSKR